MTKRLQYLFVLIFFFPKISYGVSSVGKVEKVIGDLFVFSDPLPNLPKINIEDLEVRVKFQDRYWKSRRLHVEDEVFLQDIIQCRENCNASIRLTTGSQLMLSRNTHLKVSSKYLKYSTDPTFFDLIFGALRAVIIKQIEQPEFRSKSSVLGVRGTDFIISTQNGATKVAVIEGEVGVKTKIRGYETPAISIKEGSQASIPALNPKQMKHLSEKQIENKLAALKKPEVKPITAAEVKEIKEVSGDLIKEDIKLAKIAERVMPTSKAKDREEFHSFAISFDFGHVLLFSAKGYDPNDVDYSLFHQIFEYRFWNKPYGIGIMLSQFDFHHELFNNRGFRYRNIETGGISIRGIYYGGYLRYSMDLMLGGTATLHGDDGEKKDYEIHGVGLHAEHDFHLLSALYFRPRLGYRFMEITYPQEPEISLHGYELGFGLVAKF